MNLKKSLVFKRCTPELIDVLVEISRQTFIDAFEKENDSEDFKDYIDSAFSIKQIKSELENTESLFYFCYLDDKLVAYFKLNEGKTQNETFTNSSIELERIYVINDYQGKGLGKDILDHIIDLATSKNVDFLWLGVWQKNESAIRFYERFGFIKFGTHPYYIGQDKQTDWLMKLNLN